MLSSLKIKKENKEMNEPCNQDILQLCNIVPNEVLQLRKYRCCVNMSNLFFDELVHSFIHSFIYFSFFLFNSFVHSFIHLFIHLYICSFTPSFIHSSIHSLIYLFIVYTLQQEQVMIHQESTQTTLHL